jgi:ribonuclease BN (tRNA processing enzyme)
MSNFSLTIIGYWGAYPGLGEATSCYLIRSGDTAVLLDCGSGSLSRLQTLVPLSSLTAVILSHYHADHIADLGCLQYSALIDMDLARRNKPLDVYGHRKSPFFDRLGYRECVLGHGFDENSSIQVGSLTFAFASMPHPDLSYAIRVSCGNSSLVYTGDTGANAALIDFSRAADVLVGETSLYDEYKGVVPGHMCAGELGETATRAGVSSLILTHLPHFGDHSKLLDQAKAAFGEKVELARTFLSIEV